MEKLAKHLNYDFEGADNLIKEEANRCEERYIQLTDVHVQ